MQKLLLLFLSFFIFSINCFAAKSDTIKGKDKNIILKKREFKDLEGWNEDNYSQALFAFLKACDRIALMPDDKNIGAGIANIFVVEFREACTFANAANGLRNKTIREYFENFFVPYEVRTWKNKKHGLFTGYYEIELQGKKEKDEDFKYPIYARPENLNNTNEYYTRSDIEDGILDGDDLELLYVDDYVDLFFLHIQGSGRIILDNNVVVKVGFDGKNNRPYTSIGKLLIEKKIMKKSEVNAASIKDWLKKNPKEGKQLLRQNQSYIFFKILKDNQIRGAMGSILIPERSLAIDSKIMPMGFPVWVETKVKNADKKMKFNKLMVTQDTGSAIVGAVRGDIFFGHGPKAEEFASHTSEEGRYYIFLPRQVVERLDREK